ncbi:thiamine pyrophosphate-binding protein [Sulfitobacter sp. HNIBRBA3233]|uniref:thiamine pyrophosphate-binding protein n=1 Tax=Sulfitobacter marinivivus TaxID=3158558 RepID=UPI0032DFC736
MPDTQMRPLGAQISHMLKDRGVDTIFGIPGVHNQEMYRGIEEAGITHVLARHEQGAGFMADGYARATGKPGVAYVITGPGLCNIMTPMGQAYSDSVPMLVLSSCLDETAARRGQLHQMKDQRAAADTVCDWSEEARTAGAAYGLIDRALTEFATGRARPKHIQVPIAVLEEPAPAAPKAVAQGAKPAEALPDGVLARLASARRPLLVLGGGARGATDALRALMARCAVPAFTTYAGRGIVAADDPMLLGSALARPESAEVFARSDLVIAVGTELAEVDLWRAHPGHLGEMIRVDIDTESLTDGAGNTHAIEMTAENFLAALASSEDLPARFDWTAGEIAKARAGFRAGVEAEYQQIPAICDALKACLPEDTMIYSDMTQFAYAATEIWDMDRPGHWHHPYGFGTLGYATPAAIGGAVARRGKPTMAIIGDYGFHYTMAELGVAVELGLSLPIFLWDNAKLGAIEASMVGAQIAPNAVVARNPDFCRLAEAFGARAVAPQTIEEMQTAVRDAFSADGPTLIHVTPAVLG